MDTLEFTVEVNAGPAKVRRVLHHDDEFRIWAGAFGEGFYEMGHRTEGGAVRFLTPDGQGMVSRIGETRPGEFLSRKHIVVVRDGVDDTDSAEARVWTPAHETYRLARMEGGTQLRVAVEIPEDNRGFVEETCSNALARIQDLAETIKD